MLPDEIFSMSLPKTAIKTAIKSVSTDANNAFILFPPMLLILCVINNMIFIPARTVSNLSNLTAIGDHEIKKTRSDMTGNKLP